LIDSETVKQLVDAVTAGIADKTVGQIYNEVATRRKSDLGVEANGVNVPPLVGE
jgi:hypothetical protein